MAAGTDIPVSCFIIREGFFAVRMRLELPPDIEVFLVTPPFYDDILKWFRGKMKEREA